MEEEKKYSALRWYLPQYFKESLEKCRFEEGAIIYKDKPVGENWGKKIKNIDYFIQIQYPPRSWVAIKNKEKEINVNWFSDVIFKRFYPNTKETVIIKTTQGRLFSFLWKDNPDIFDNTEHPLVPLFPSSQTINEHFICSKIPDGCVGFAFVFNPVNDIQISKLRSIKKVSSKYDWDNSDLDEYYLAKCDFKKYDWVRCDLVNDDILSKYYLTKYNCAIYDVEELNFQIEESCDRVKIENEMKKQNANEIYPLLTVKLLLFKNAKYDDIHELIKTAVYNPPKPKKNIIPKDVFSIKRHGLLFSK